MWKISRRLYTCILNHYLYKLKRDMTLNLLLPFLLVLTGRNEGEDQKQWNTLWSNREWFNGLMSSLLYSKRLASHRQIHYQLSYQGSPSCISEKYNKVFKKCLHNNGCRCPNGSIIKMLIASSVHIN